MSGASSKDLQIRIVSGSPAVLAWPWEALCDTRVLPVKEPVPLLSDLEDAMLAFWKAWKEDTELYKELLEDEGYCDEIGDLIEECRNFLEDYEKKYL